MMPGSGSSVENSIAIGRLSWPFNDGDRDGGQSWLKTECAAISIGDAATLGKPPIEKLGEGLVYNDRPMISSTDNSTAIEPGYTVMLPTMHCDGQQQGCDAK